MTGNELLKLLKKHGWHVRRIKGSHHIMEHHDHPGIRLTVPIHGSQEVPTGTAHHILKQAGLK